MSARIMILFVALIWGEMLLGNGFQEAKASFCQGIWIKGQYAIGHMIKPQLTTQETQQLKDWATRFGLDRSTHVANLPHELTAYVLSEIPASIRFKLFTHEGVAISGRQAESRLRATDDVTVTWWLLTKILRDDIGGDSNSALTKVENEIARFEKLNSERKAATMSEVARRVKEAKAAEILSDQRHPFYRLKIFSDHIQVPDGKEYKIIKRLGDGTIVFEMPLSSIIRTEDYRSLERILFHMREMERYPKQYENGIMLAKSPRSIGELTADGRFFILDGHARSEAYANHHNGMVRVDVQPAADGLYYAMPHYNVMRFFGVWQTLPEAERVRIQDAAMNGSLSEVREAYYRYWNVERLANP